MLLIDSSKIICTCTYMYCLMFNVYGLLSNEKHENMKKNSVITILLLIQFSVLFRKNSTLVNPLHTQFYYYLKTEAFGAVGQKRQKLSQGGQKKFSSFSSAILPLIKMFLFPLKIKSAPDEKKPGHDSALKDSFLLTISFKKFWKTFTSKKSCMKSL